MVADFNTRRKLLHVLGSGALLLKDGSVAQELRSSINADPIRLGSISAAQPFTSMTGHYVQLLGSSKPLTQVSETSGITGEGTITGPHGPSAMRFGKIADPLNTKRTVFYMAAKRTDGMTHSHLGRVEMGINQRTGAMQKKGVTYWMSTEMLMSPSRFAAGNGNLLQVHNSTPTSDVFGPFAVAFQTRVFPNRGATVVRAWSSQSSPKLPGFNAQVTYPWTSNNAGFPGNPVTGNITQTFGAYPVGQWVKFVCKYRGDPYGHSGLLQIWLTTGVETTPIVNLSDKRIGTAPQGFASDYVKTGLDDFSLGGGADGVWELRRSLSLYQDNGNTEPQIRALMP